MDDLSPAQARSRLAAAASTTLTTDRDRRAYALGMAGFGVAMGLFVVADRLTDGHGWWSQLVLPAYVVLLMVTAEWQRRAARTVPRHAGVVAWCGVGGSVVLMLAAIMVLNYRRASVLDGAGEQAWVLVATGVVVALPMLVAALVVRRAR